MRKIVAALLVSLPIADTFTRLPARRLNSCAPDLPAAMPGKAVSSMPIIPPKGEPDPKVIKAPAPSVDYKLLVKPTEIGPSR